jgi:hypothetical protein
MHLRESVPYGNWQMPVKYTPTKTGGYCASGCHKKLAYDRGKAIPLPGRREPKPTVKTTTQPGGKPKKPLPKWMEGIDINSSGTFPSDTKGSRPTTQPTTVPAGLKDSPKDSSKTFDLRPADPKNTPDGSKPATKPASKPAKN